MARTAVAQVEQNMHQFSAMKWLNANTLKAINQDFGYTEMTPVQYHVLKQQLDVDLLVRAKTGTGKTLAFLIAALEKSLREKEFSNKSVGILVISPTRELANQIGEEATKLTKRHGLKVVMAVGGTSRFKLCNQLKSRTDILVGTPGRLADMLENEAFVADKMKKCKMLILDEADELLNMGFRSELDRITAKLHPERSTLMFSATISPKIRDVAKSILKPSYSDLDIVPKDEAETHTKIRQSFAIIQSRNQLNYLYNVLESYKSNHTYKIIVFFTTTKMVQFANSIFSGKMDIMQIHSKMEQRQRERISSRFKTARSAILFTSDVSARGVDYPNVNLVISFGVPASREQYIHRIGRTGRAGKEGEALLILNPLEERFMKNLADLPIRDELRYNIVPVESSRLKRSLENIDPDDRSSVVKAIGGFYASNMKAFGLDGHEIIKLLKDIAESQFLLPHAVSLPLRLIQQLGLENTARHRNHPMKYGKKSFSGKNDRSRNWQ